MGQQDRWSALSMKDKASLIKIFVDGGILSLDDMRAIYNEYKKGGSIHIKPENRGKFTATKKRTGKTTEELTHSKNPLTRKRAIFAQNAKRWKHADGGPLGDKDTLNSPIYNAAQEQAMYNYLSSQGLNDAQVSGLMGNLAVESLLNADINQTKGPAYGLMQAEGARKKALKEYNDVPYMFGSGLLPEEQKQLDYIINKGINEYTQGEWGKEGFAGARDARKAFLNEQDSIKASDIITKNYLRPSKPHLKRRRDMTAYYYDKYGKNVANYPLLNSKWNISNSLKTNKFGEGGTLDSYTVQKGDTLTRIAKRYLGNYEEYKTLADINNIDNPDIIYEGQKLQLSREEKADIELPNFWKKEEAELDVKTLNQSKKDVERLQEFLINRGYDIGPTGKDGIIGKYTTAALQNYLVDSGYDIGDTGIDGIGIDGQFGPKTRQAFRDAFKSETIKKENLPIIATKQNKEEYHITAPEIRKAALNANKIEKPQIEIPKKAEYKKPNKEIKTLAKPTYIEDNHLEDFKEDEVENVGQRYNPKFDSYIKEYNFSNVYNVPMIKYQNTGDWNSENSGFRAKYKLDKLEKDAKETGCAAAVTRYALDSVGGGFIDKKGLRGHAWTLGEEVVKHGGIRIYNMYGLEGAPRENDSSVTIDYARKVAKTKDYKEKVASGMQPGNIVELLYPGSEHFEEAYKESNGNNQSTHIGDIVEYKGQLYVRDNMGGTYHYRKVDDVINGKDKDGILITGVVSPTRGYKDKDLYRADMSKIGITPNKELFDKYKKKNGFGIKYYKAFGNEAAYRSMYAIASNKDVLQAEYDLTDKEFNEVSALVNAFGVKETNMGRIEGKWAGELGESNIWQNLGRHILPKYTQQVTQTFIRDRINNINKILGEKGVPINENNDTNYGYENLPILKKILKPESMGLMNVKVFNRYTREELDNIGGWEALREEQPEASAIYSFKETARNYKFWKEKFKQIKNKDFVDKNELLIVACAMSQAQRNENMLINLQRFLETGEEKELLQYKNTEQGALISDFVHYYNYNIIQPEETKRPEKVKEILNRDPTRRIRTMVAKQNEESLEDLFASLSLNDIQAEIGSTYFDKKFLTK